MTTSMIDERFGILAMEGEKLIFASAPDRLMRLALVGSLISVVGIPLIPLVWLVTRISQDKYRYWLTNRRVILSSGFIGYSVRSIPLERISDVGLSCSLIESLAGVTSVVVRDMTGEAESGKYLLAIQDGPERQRQILNEVQRVNRDSLAL